MNHTLKYMFKKSLSIIVESYKKLIEIFVVTFEIFLNIIDKTVSFIVKYALVFIVIFIFVLSFIYISSPALFYWLINMSGFSLNDLTLSEKIELQKDEIKELNLRLEKLQDQLKQQQIEKNIINQELNKVIEEKNGLISGLKSIIYNQNNWWVIILIITGITIVGGCVVYFILDSPDNLSFNILTNFINNNEKSIIAAINQSTQTLNDNILLLSEKLNNINIDIDVLKNTIDIIKKKIDQK